MLHFRKSVLLTVAFLLITLYIGAFSVSADTFPCVGIVVANDVNVRSGAGTEFPVQSVVNAGVTLDVYAKINNWFKIGTGNNGHAFISADYVSIRPEDLSSRASEALGGRRVVAFAKKFLGTPYRYGGSSPSGFDCSGFTSYIYKQLGYSLNRTAHAQLSNGIEVSKSELLPGDLVMFKKAGNSEVHHVGIYAGDGMMIHSPQTGDVVKLTSITTGYYNSVYYSARRIIR